MRIVRLVEALVTACDARLRRYRHGGLGGNDDGDLSGAQQLALTAVGVAIIVGVLMPLLSGGMSGVVNDMLSKLSGL